MRRSAKFPKVTATLGGSGCRFLSHAYAEITDRLMYHNHQHHLELKTVPTTPLIFIVLWEATGALALKDAVAPDSGPSWHELETQASGGAH
ncbi:hypothetical protein PAXRUDRAFT_595826 [Paxillus rubicundulus Ve08.2h10]|uniref:Uncharacterized protein n=1 Tax=Paxillus rubicundulus Ve08.2h10 TaxID=930991 RepID=A0A0D0E4D0_9AGAM|nr:hypothetical protein PAXRUDRAFT_595826 [Paxillus rubicundulus Ve08.2h10]